MNKESTAQRILNWLKPLAEGLTADSEWWHPEPITRYEISSPREEPKREVYMSRKFSMRKDYEVEGIKLSQSDLGNPEIYNCSTCSRGPCNVCSRILEDGIKRSEAFSKAKKIALEVGDRKEYDQLDHLYYCGWSLEDAQKIISRKKSIDFDNYLKNK